MSKRRIRKAPFWKLAVRYGVIFMIVVVIIQAVMEIFKSGNFNKISESLSDGTWVQFVINILILGIVYGVTMALIQKNNVKKQEKKR
jgi:phosphotransferase system  glucose/maltose/N-acetylglucosamine-specific IIC component